MLTATRTHKFMILGTIYVKHRENSKGKRNSGGIAVYIRKTIIGGTSFVTTRNKNILWIKLDKSFFELDKDLYLGTFT